MTCFARQRHTRLLGLSLVELLIAIFVVSVGVLGTLSALWYGIRSERYAERRTEAVNICRELVNVIRTHGYARRGSIYMVPNSELNDGDYYDDSDDDGVRHPFNAPPFANLYPDNPYNFERHVEMVMLSDDPNSHLYNLAGVKVTLLWDEGGSEKKMTLWSYQKN